MERKHSKLKTFPSFKPKNRDDPRCVFVHHRYVGLKDIIQGSSLQNDTANNNTFDSSNISIRNELVKHAASAYIQSATSLVNRDQPLLEAFWGKMINSLSLPSCCHIIRGVLVVIFFLLASLPSHSSSVELDWASHDRFLFAFALASPCSQLPGSCVHRVREDYSTKHSITLRQCYLFIVNTRFREVQISEPASADRIGFGAVRDGGCAAALDH
uniref:Uncharacterized protein LOC104243078 n=1 Tax=Nicotiana sylvestris TaxID=4096 RepID=A0A1U7YB79_NICSY